MKREKMKSLAASGSAPASVDQVTIGAEERVRWLTAAYRESSIKDRPRNVIGLLKELPPEEMEAILLADVKIDDDALRLLANARAQSVKDELTTRGIIGDRLFLTVPRLSGERPAAAAGAAQAGRAAPNAAAADSASPSARRSRAALRWRDDRNGSGSRHRICDIRRRHSGYFFSTVFASGSRANDRYLAHDKSGLGPLQPNPNTRT